MNVKNGISINGVHSYNDYGLLLADRDITLPERQTNFVTIPYMNGYYDMSAIAGTYYGSRTLTYTFDILADDETSTEEFVNKIYDWAKGAIESKIYDDADPDYYFVGSFTGATYSPDSDLPECGGQIELTFTAQPYRYNRETDEGVI